MTNSPIPPLPEEEFRCRRIPTWSMRQPSKPCWAATYHGRWSEGAERVVGLLVPRPCKHNRNALSHLVFSNGRPFESPLGVFISGEWYTARANELPREQWTAIRDFYKNLPQPHDGC
ncbi:hypothetical protein ACFWNT_45495 [Streptomyces sp. NPDC058409]|uniref:hypothetical protein n=1 Tax=Streptomyces sp. NPDC058409 TaxID=3346484 RepID=UPI003661D559